MKNKKPKFLRKDTKKKLRLGKKRKKKQKWRRARGRDNKIRQKRKGHGKQPSIGYGLPKKIRKKKPKLIYSSEDLDRIEKVKDEIIQVGKIGKKRKIEIAKKAIDKKIKILNLNAKKLLKKIEAEKKKKEAEKKKEEKEKKEAEEKKKKEEKKEREKALHKDALKENIPQEKIKPKGEPKEKKEMFRKTLEK